MIKNYLLSKSKDEIIDIFTESLDLMEQYNGRSKMYCICRAAGFKETAEGTFEIPSKLN